MHESEKSEPMEAANKATLYLCCAEGLQILTCFLPNFLRYFDVNTSRFGARFYEGLANSGTM